MSKLDSTGPYGYCHCGCGQKTKLAKTTRTKWNTVKGKPMKYIHGHNAYYQTPLYVEEDRGYDSPCWIWQRSFNTYGHGQITIQGKCFLAHRVFYEKRYGPVSTELDLHHMCEQPDCMNPDHLQPLTPAAHARTRKSTKLSIEDCKEMYRIYHSEDTSYRLVGLRFGVSTMGAWKAVRSAKEYFGAS